jgi:hypothetical protein
MRTNSRAPLPHVIGLISDAQVNHLQGNRLQTGAIPDVFIGLESFSDYSTMISMAEFLCGGNFF